MLRCRRRVVRVEPLGRVLICAAALREDQLKIRSTELLRASVRGISLAEREQYLKQLKADGRVLQYDVALTLEQGRKLADYIVVGAESGGTVGKIDLAGLKTEIDLTEQRVSDLRERASGDPDGAQREYGQHGQSYDLDASH